jgi:uncharacterized protein YndB with AHSA1/START domain
MRRPAIALAACIACSAAGPNMENHSPFPLRLEHKFPASREKVFQAWIDPALVRRWFPDDAHVHWVRDPKVEAWPGGQLDWEVASDDNPQEIFHFRGFYREVEASAKLAFTWSWKSLPIDGVHESGQTVVSIKFVDDDGGTKIVLIQTRLPSEAARDAHDRGWRRCFKGIEKAVRGL